MKTLVFISRPGPGLFALSGMEMTTRVTLKSMRHKWYQSGSLNNYVDEVCSVNQFTCPVLLCVSVLSH